MHENLILGLTIEEANESLKNLQYFVREVKQDNINLICTDDMIMNRINVETKGNKIVKIHSIG